LGSEFQVNSYTRGNQWLPAIAASSAGAFVVVWRDAYQDGDLLGVFGQQFAGDGQRLGEEFQVNAYTSRLQDRGRLAFGTDGTWLAVWESFLQDGDQRGIFGQRFASGGERIGGEFQVNTFTLGTQSVPDIASDGLGRFGVVWTSNGQDGDSRGVFGQRLTSAGEFLGSEFQVNSHTVGSQLSPTVNADGDGNLVVVWSTRDQDGDQDGIFARRFASNGEGIETEFQVNTYTIGRQSGPEIAASPASRLVVVWGSADQDGDGFGIFGRRLSSTGEPLSGEFQVNAYTQGSQLGTVDAAANGDFVVAWVSGGIGDVFAHRFSICGNGDRSGAEQCDDGNSIDGDGCETNCELSPTKTPTITAKVARTVTPTQIATATPRIVPGPCAGDCDLSGTVGIEELVTGIDIALGRLALSTCPFFDDDRDFVVSVNELVKAVGHATRGCPD
jgi:cysteine-rich repeat protein